MANIAINNYCNLKCLYCFAEDMINQPNKNMSLEDYIKVLKYLTEQNTETSIGIIGGEPTLHPQFKEILIESNQCANQNDTTFILFTNGIELEPFLPYIGNNIKILINCNNLINTTHLTQFFSTLNHIKDLGWFDNGKVTCGCNLFLEERNYHWTWFIADYYKIPQIRCSIVSPSGVFVEWRNKKDEYFKKMKPIFLDFCKEAQKRKIRLILDCGHIPACYFSIEELELIKEVTCSQHYFIDIGCNPVMDITPDLQIIPCFGSYTTIPLDFNDNWIGLTKYINYNYNIPKALNNTQGGCANCLKLQKLQCQGGCLAFSSPS